MSDMASSVSASVSVPQGTKRTHVEMSSSEMLNQQNQSVQSSLQADFVNSTTPLPGTKGVEPKVSLESRAAGNAVSKLPATDPVLVNSYVSQDSHQKENVAALSSMTPSSEDNEAIKHLQKPLCDAAKTINEIPKNAPNLPDGASHPVENKVSLNGTSEDESSTVTTLDIQKPKKATENAPHVPTSSALSPTSQLESSTGDVSGPAKSTLESMETSVAIENENITSNPNMENAAPQSKHAANKNFTNTKSSSSKSELEYGEEPEKKAKIVPSSSKTGGRTPEQILEYMDKTFEQRRKIITKQMPSIPELKELYPDLFTGKQLLLEFQRITKIDIDQKIQEFCVRYATAVIEMARNKKGAAPVLARWEQAKQENDTLRQYWDMVTALCLLPLHFGENFVEMVLEIGEDEEVVPQGKIVPTLVARGNIFRTDEFFLIAENTIVQEFEEFTIAFASLYSSYWVFNMEYPETIQNTYDYIQRCIVRQREPGSVPTVCKNFTKALLKWNKGKEGK